MWAAVEALLDDALGAGLFAGCALAVRGPERVHYLTERGFAEREPTLRPLRPGTAFDLASLTKVLGTTAIAMRLVGEGRLDLDAPVSEILPYAPHGVTAAQLLQHSSGLPAWRRLFDEVESRGLAWGAAATRDFVVRQAATTPTLAEPGARHSYSDLGFLLLGALLEEVGGGRLDGGRLDGCRLDQIAGNLGGDLRYGWPGAAATERCPLRGGVIVGTVHDLNGAVMGGVAGHAGLFGSAESVAAAAAWQLRSWLAGGDGLELTVLRRFWSDRGAGSHALGWDTPSPGACSAGPRWPLDGVGHLGFTGCSVWIAPRQQIVVAFLSNRVHPIVEGGSVPGAPEHPRYTAFRALRPRLHTAVIEALVSQGLWQD